MNTIKQIMKFQSDRLLDKQPYDFENESVNILEEIFESGGLKVSKENREKLKSVFEQAIHTTFKFGIGETDKEYKKDPEYHTIDAYADIIVFCVGAIMKIGYNPEKVLLECSKEINSRTGKIVDGKFQKDTDIKVYKADYSECKE